MTRNRREEVEAFVLAGGRSTRFGSNKALAEWEGRPLLTHALAVAAELGLSTRVVCPDPSPYRGLATSFVTTERPGRGPAEAIRAALLAAAAPWALVLGTDMPGVDAPLLWLLLDAIEDGDGLGHGADDGDESGDGAEDGNGFGDGAEAKDESGENSGAGRPSGAAAICFEDSSGRRHPLPGLYHRALLDRFEDLGEAPAVNALLDLGRARVLGPAHPPPGIDLDRRLRNVNRPEDLSP